MDPLLIAASRLLPIVVGCLRCEIMRVLDQFGWLPIVVGCLLCCLGGLILGALDKLGWSHIVVVCLLGYQIMGWLPIVVGCLMGALYQFGWLPVVVGCLTSALVIKAVTAFLEAWAKRMIDLGGETLKEQLLKLGALLTSARGFRTNNSELKELVEEFQQLKYQAENLLDELDYYRLKDQIQQRGGTQEKGNYISQSSAATSSSDLWLASRSILSTFKGMSSLVSLPKIFRINFSQRMNELAEQLQKSEEKVRYSLQTKSLVISKTARNTKISHIEATKLHQLMNLLTNEESAMVGKVPVIAIVGSGGVGKTTLARLVFTDPKIRSYFEVRLWICVSTQFDSVRFTREMLEDACGNKYDGLSNLNVLQTILKEKLESKRFLLVLDDMWEDEDKSQWDLMVAPLKYCRVRGSIILVTTRNQSVAKLVGARDIIYLQGQTSSFLTEPTVFGRHQERDQLMNLLTNEKSAMVGKVPVIAMVGSGGVGKTTLARLVFTDPKICSYFEVRLWICVSTQFDSVRLTREMLEHACGNKYDGLSNLDDLQKVLKDKLEFKRFLLVLDDMWEDEHKSQWDLMVAPLNYCRVRGSIILVTTRNQSVAKLVGARDIIYLQGLDDNAFSLFFSTCIFNDSNYGGNWRLRNIGQQIANKLKGNPLAAKIVSAQLKTNLDERYWIEVRDSEDWKSQSGPNDIFRRHQECDQLMNLLTNTKSAMVGKVPVIAIVGSGGVGKTTLARLVFTDPKICSYFEVRLWICVSTQFDSVRLTREMLEHACGNKYDELGNLNDLQKILKDKLEFKRFLLVLDDMWEDEHKSQWDLVVAPLNYCRVRGSIILVTTRNQSVAKLVDARDIIYLQGQTSSFLNEPIVFRRYQERDQLMNLLTNKKSTMVGKVPVIAMVGSGGVGKTTLARLVFTDPKICSYFEIRLWICVSTQFDSVRLTREMLEHTCGNKYDELSNLNDLQKLLKDKLEFKRFLLVLDDMWEDEHKSQWDLMVAPLNYCRVRGSIILVTTRNQSIAKLVDAGDIIYLQGQTSSFLTEPTVFGRHQERDQLMNLLTNKKSTMVGKVPVIAMVGSGGVGKTTLARLVFTDPKICSYFEVRLWICVSTQFDSVRLTREMLEHACGHKYDELSNLNDLQKILKDKLEFKRFLLVLDDMWEDEHKSQWDLMVAPLNYCMVRGSIILVTTRKQSVAKLIGARDIIYLQGLDDNAFSSFFSTCIFNDSNYRGNWRLRNIGQEIANKLKGNPLAAKTVSAQLKKNLDERYWIEVRDSEDWKSQSGPNDILYALRLNYEHMPIHLQRCFSCCAIFPEDRPFTCKEVVYLWMAQGFLDVRSERKMEDIGSAYFNDLFNRGFFQIKQSIDGLVYYTFHDFIHDLAHSVAFKECLIINGTKPRQILPTIRHLSIFGSTERNEDAIVTALACMKGENLRTIIIWDDELSSGICQSISDLLKKTKFLRAMRLKIGSMVQQHNFIQNFVSLRYLSINLQSLPGSINTSSYTLPREICRLYHLEVFEIEGGGFLDELPNNFSDLVSLRHFIVEGKLHSKICDVGKLTSVQELNHFDVQQKMGFEIEQLGSLREIGGTLHIWNLENVKSTSEASMARLAEKEKLDALHLQWNHGEQENESVLEGLKPSTYLNSLTIDGYGGVASPRWLGLSIFFLETLNLKGCKAWELLSPIGELEFLKHLTLSGLAVREIGPQCYGTPQSMIFPSLEELEIIDMPYLEKWLWSDQLKLFPRLKELTIKGCNKLVDLPLSGCATSEVLERFSSLEILIIGDCPLIFQLPPLPYNSLLSSISIARTGIIESMLYEKKRQELSLTLDKRSSNKMSELLSFHGLSSLRVLEISYISSLESLDLHYFVALEKLVIRRCQSLTSLTFGEHLVCLKTLCIISCQTLSSMEGLKSWVNLENLYIRKCPGFIAAWETASKEIERTEPDFCLSLTRIEEDSLSLLTLPICKQVTSLQILELRFYAFTEEHEISPLLLTSIDLVDIKGCKNLQSFPFDLFPSLKELRIMFPRIQSLPTNSRTKITEKCLEVKNIKEIYIRESPLKIEFVLSSEEMICQQWMELISS